MSAFTALVRKDVRLYLSNRRALLMSLVAPILISAFMGAVLGGTPSKPQAVPFAVVDLDRSPVSQKIVTSLSQDSSFAVQSLPQGPAIDLVRKGTIRAAAIISKGFGDQATKALFRPDLARPTIELHFDPSQAMTLELIKGLLTQHVMQVVTAAAFDPANAMTALTQAREHVARNTALDPALRTNLLNMFKDIEEVDRQTGIEGNAKSGIAQGLTLPYVTRDIEVTNGETNYNVYAHAFAGMTVQFILLMGVELGVGLLLMRRMGLWQRLRAAPLSRATLLGSRIVAGTIIALLLMCGIFAAAIAVFGVRIQGSWLGFVAIAVAFAALTSTLGLLIAAIGRTPEATRGMAIVLTLLLVMLGGAWVPTFVFPEWLQSATRFVPTRWAIDGFDAMTWRAQPLQAIVWPMTELLGLSAVLGALAISLFRWEE
jgi:ABC-2 type transport system permease protein